MNDGEFAVSLVQTYGNMRYIEGMKRELSALETARNWLTRQPDRKWQKEICGWVDNFIKEYKEEIKKFEEQK